MGRAVVYDACVLYPAPLRDLLMHVCEAAKRQRGMLRKPPKSVDEYLETLERLGLSQTAARLRHFAEVI